MPGIRRVLQLRQSCLISRSFAAEFPDLEVDGPATSKEAITEGLKLHRSGRYHEALMLFNRSLELPGSGARLYRLEFDLWWIVLLALFRDKAPGTSQGEKVAAFYNIACCYSALKDSRKSLVAVAGIVSLTNTPISIYLFLACMEVGYRDFENLTKDPDLAHVRKDPRFQALLSRYQVTEDSVSNEWSKQLWSCLWYVIPKERDLNQTIVLEQRVGSSKERLEDFGRDSVNVFNQCWN